MKHQLCFSFQLGPAIKEAREIEEVLYDIICAVVRSFNAEILDSEGGKSFIIRAHSRLDLFKIALKLKDFFAAHMQFYDRKYRAVPGCHTHLISDYLLCQYQIEKNPPESQTIMQDAQAIKQAKAAAIGNTSHIG